jgi:hypothetical protein
MTANDGMLPPVDAVNQQLADTLSELNGKLRKYFEIDVNQNTNAVAKLIKKISSLDSTNANLEKVIQEIPKVAQEVSFAINEFKELKKEEIYLKKQNEARREAGEKFDAMRAQEENIKKTFTQGPGGTSGFEGMIAKSVEALFSKKAREELIEDYKEYTSAIKKEQTRDRKKTIEEEKKEYIDAALAKKGLKNEYSLQTIVGTSVEEELNRFSKKEDTDKKKPPTEVILVDINKKVLDKLSTMFSSGGGGPPSSPGMLLAGPSGPRLLPPGPGQSNNSGGSGGQVLTTSNRPALPEGPGGPVIYNNPRTGWPAGAGKTSKPALPAPQNRPLLGPGDDVIDIGGPEPRPGRPGRPIKDVTPKNVFNKRGAPEVLKNAGRFIGGRVVPMAGAFTTGWTIGSLIRDIPMFGKSLGERLDDMALSMFGLTDEQISQKYSLTPSGSLPEVPEEPLPEEEAEIEPEADMLSNIEGQSQAWITSNDIQKLTTSIDGYTNALNTTLQSITEQQVATTGRQETSGSTAFGNINNNSSVNNIVYNADNRINVNRDMFKETIKFNYKLLK